MPEMTEEIDQPVLPGMPEPPSPPPVQPFMIEGSCERRTDVIVDLAKLIREFPREYAATDIHGYQRWERPVVFVSEFVQENSGGQYGYRDIVSEEGFDSFDFTERPRWSREQYEALCQVCPEAAL